MKGHATGQNVQGCPCTKLDGEGNDKADLMADKGVNDHTYVVVKTSRGVAKRQDRYVALLREIQEHCLKVCTCRKSWKYEKKIGSLRKKYIMEDRQRLIDTIERFTPTYKAVIKNCGQVSACGRCCSRSCVKSLVGWH